MVSLLDEKRQWFKARVGLTQTETPREISFCAHALHEPDLLIVPDAAADERFANSPLVVNDPKVKFYAGVPLRTSEGHALGTLCVMDQTPRELEPNEEQALRTLARQVMAQLELRRHVLEFREHTVLLRDTLDSLTSNVALLDDRGTIIYVNAAWKRFAVENTSDGKETDFIGVNYLAACQTKSQFQDATIAKQAIEGIRSVIEGRQPIFTLEYPCHSPQQLRWFILRATRLNSEKGGAVIAHQDITERKLAEAGSNQLAAIVAFSDDAIIGKDLESIVTSWNHGAEKIFGYSAQEMIGASILRLIPEDRIWEEEHIIEAILRGESLEHFETVRRCKDGRLIDVSITASPIKNAQGETTGVSKVARDITARKAAEAELKLFRSLVDHSSDTFEVIEPKTGRFLDVNLHGPLELGCTREEYLARRVGEIDPGVGAEGWPELARRIQEAGALSGEARHQRMDGTTFPIEFNARWVHLDHDYIVTVVRDISQRKEAEKALRESEERMHIVMEQMNEGLILSRLNGEIIYWNPSALAMHGYTSEEEARKSLPELATIYELQTAQGEVLPMEQRPLQRVLRGETIRDVIVRVRKIGEAWERVFRCNGTIVRESSGEPLAFITITNITARFHAEEKVREQAALLDKARDAIIVRDLDHRIVYWNEGATRLYGWSAEEVMGQSVQELFYDDPSAFLAATETAMQTGEWVGEIEQVAKDRRRLIVEGRWTLVRDERERPKCILAINTDLTERKKLEQQFLRAQRMESIGTLAGGIAHDLNNVLGPIITALELLQMRFEDETSQELLSILRTSAERGADMVRQVLSFARGITGQRLEVQIRHLVRDIEKIVNDTFLKHVTMRAQISSDLWTVIGDATQLHQVLLNLCVNARDAMPNGGKLTISAENVTFDEHYAGLNIEATAGPYICLQVEDTGTGMPPDIIEKIFDPFFTTKEIGKGTGLGLSTTLAIVKSHGGFVRVYSELNRGTKFKVFLPATPGDSGASASTMRAEILRGHGETVLVVDDEAAVRQITQQTLEAFGYRVIVACDGAEALAIYSERKAEIAVVLTDMMMPVMDGPALIQVLHRLTPKLPIIAASGLSANGQIVYSDIPNVKNFLSKPYTAESLLKALQTALASPGDLPMT